MAIKLWVNLEVSRFLEQDLHRAGSDSLFDRNCLTTDLLSYMVLIGFDIYLNTEVEPFRN